MKYIGFPPYGDGATVIGIERISDMVDEIAVLHEEHYKETEKLYLDPDFLPDYERYKRLEEEKQFVVFTVRENWKMIGYLQYYVFRDMHTASVLTAREDAYFITKQHRGRGLASPLLQYAEECLYQLGCRYVGMTSKGPVGGPEIGPFLENRDYRPVAMFYMKDLER